MKKSELDSTHECYDAKEWKELEALSVGGKKFHSLITTFLPPQPMEPEQRYIMRTQRARYYSYTGSIINLYTGWLFANGFEAKACEKGSTEPVTTLDSFYGEFQEKVAGETTLRSFMKARFREAMTVGHSVWIAELPDTSDLTITTRADYDKAKAGRVTLKERCVDQLLDWEEDEEGTLIWAKLKTVRKERSKPGGSYDKIVEEWRVYEAETVTTYIYERKINDAPDPNKDIEGKATRHGFKRVPVMRLCLPSEMCIGSQTKDAQISHFQHDNALSWSMYMTCYAMPVFKIENVETPPVLGVGYALFIGPNDDMNWVSPPTDSYDAIAKNRDSKRDEIFRIVHQMAQGLDNNAETVGRSAESKEIDAAATRIMLNAYGELVGECIESMYEMISEARDEKDLVWSVEGFSGYDVATAATLLANVKAARSLGIPSETLHKELTKKAAKVLTTELDENVKATIRKEIDGYKFTVTDQMLEQQVQSDKLASEEKRNTESVVSKEKISKDSLKSQEKVAKSRSGTGQGSKPVSK